MNGQKKHFYVFGPFRFDREERILLRDSKPVPLAPKVTETLLLLVQNAGHLVDKDDLMKGVWPDVLVEEGNLNKNIFVLRKVLGQWDGGLEYIETVPKRGYRFVAPIGVLAANPPESTAASEISLPLIPIEGSQRAPRRLSASMWLTFGLVTLTIGGALAVWSKPDNSLPKIVGSKQVTNDGLPKTSGPVSDGSRIYFSEFSSGRNILKEVGKAGGETEVIQTSVPDPVIEDFSPEDSQLLVQASKDQWNPEGSDFWLVPVPRGPARRMEGIVGRAGGWVPALNGKFYFGKGKDLYVANHDGNNAYRIATAAGQVGAIRSLPDGSRLRFTVFDLGKYKYSLWEVRLDGSGLHPVLPGWNAPPRECCGTWTPDGRYYFFRGVQHDIGYIWMMQERTGPFHKAASPPLQLTAGPISYANLAFGKEPDQLFAVGEQRRAELVAYDKRSGNFASFLDGVSAGELDFSRDGQWVAYVTYPDGLLWRSKLDGSERLQLTFPPVHAALVHWSPDGRRITFSEIQPGRPWKISLASRDGGTPQQLTSDDLVEVDPNWSPDGNLLAYGVYPPGRPDQGSIRLLDLRTRRSSQLPGSEGICFPRWSPDGRYLVGIPFDATRLMVFDFKTSNWRELIKDVGTIGYFSWSRDSAYLYFDSSLTEDPAYLRVRISDSKLERIAGLKAIRRYISDFGVPWSGLGPGERPLFARDISTQEIYELDWQLP